MYILHEKNGKTETETLKEMLHTNKKAKFHGDAQYPPTLLCLLHHTITPNIATKDVHTLNSRFSVVSWHKCEGMRRTQFADD